jgi:hypothetical protein
MRELVYTKAEWISEEDLCGLDDTLLATKGDILEVHGKHSTDGEYVVKGTRDTIFFWAKPEDIKLSDPI